MSASSMVYEYLKKYGHEDLIQKYGLEPFDLKVQTAERTLIDKLFALGDYYLSDKVTEHSRHIYDIYKLLDVVTLDDSIKALIKEVAKERKENPTCLSAQEGVEMNALLQEIIDKQIYKEDYENITASLLFENVPYADAVKAVQKLIDMRIFE